MFLSSNSHPSSRAKASIVHIQNRQRLWLDCNVETFRENITRFRYQFEAYGGVRLLVSADRARRPKGVALTSCIAWPRVVFIASDAGPCSIHVLLFNCGSDRYLWRAFLGAPMHRRASHGISHSPREEASFKKT